MNARFGKSMAAHVTLILLILQFVWQTSDAIAAYRDLGCSALPSTPLAAMSDAAAKFEQYSLINPGATGSLHRNDPTEALRKRQSIFESCAATAASAGQTFFGIHNNVECWACSHRPAAVQYGTSAACGRCRDYPSAMCGGPEAISFYELLPSEEARVLSPGSTASIKDSLSCCRGTMSDSGMMLVCLQFAWQLLVMTCVIF